MVLGKLLHQGVQFPARSPVIAHDQYVRFPVSPILERNFKKKSGNQFPNNLSSELAELLVPAGVVVGQFVVVESQKIEPSNVHVTDMVDALHRLGADLVGSA